MALIVPYDSSGNIIRDTARTSDSYVTLDAFRTYAALVGISLNPLNKTNANNADEAPEDDLNIACRRGTILVDAMANRFTGKRTDGDNALAWPREGAYRQDTTVVSSESIPKAVRDATCWAAGYALANPEDILKVIQESRYIKKEKVGSLEREYGDLKDVRSFIKTISTVTEVLSDLIDKSDAEKARETALSTFVISGKGVQNVAIANASAESS